MRGAPGCGRRVIARDRAPRSPWSPVRSQGRSVERIERVASQRFLCPTGKAGHALRIAEALIPASLVFPDAASLFFLTKEEGVTEYRAPCFCRESMHGFEEGGVCFFGHGWKLNKAAGNVEVVLLKR